MGEGTSDRRSLLAAYKSHLRNLEYAIHELPSGVLYGANAATGDQCKLLMNDLYAFQEVCRKLGIDREDFIQDCHWTLDHSPHYLSRHRPFRGYRNYIAKRGGPVRVTVPRS